ncbi:Cupin 2 conserved barrel domain protein [Desulfamplus magnetovallimortis]|uniref:Cupin 2 conserved barrel domain protein n=2 Tax=Desulfamplus magnetovallimortis TaxID=1246637 RepID=A0A1W1HD40_9BACT|nr:Cupin 2 conserved barrel domain protein [Desulfamplus magnetovallimortis]
MFYKADESGYKEVLTGIKIKTLTYGEKTLFTEFRMESGKKLPAHSHPYEQTGYLIKGKILLTIAGNSFEVEPGDCWTIPSGADHGAEILQDSVAIEVFSPVREDYLQYFTQS